MAAAPSQPLQGLSETEFQALRDQTLYLLNRAYQNLYGLSIPTDQSYQRVLMNAAMQSRLDARTRGLNERELLRVCEDIIRISDEHARLAQQHMARAGNPIYLRETAIDNLSRQRETQAMLPLADQPSPVILSLGQTRHKGVIFHDGEFTDDRRAS